MDGTIYVDVTDIDASLLQPLLVGAGGLTVASQISNRFRSAGKALNDNDIAVLDAAEYHYYQVSTLAISLHVIL